VYVYVCEKKRRGKYQGENGKEMGRREREKKKKIKGTA
jgi:hypothetical protein